MKEDKAKLRRILLNKMKGVPMVSDDEIIEELGEGALEELSNNKGEDE